MAGRPAEPRCRDRERQGKVSFVEIIFFFLRQGLACLSLLSDGIAGTGHHAWFTHMILNWLKKKKQTNWRLFSSRCEGSRLASSVLNINMVAACPLVLASTGLFLCWGVSRKQTVGGGGCQPWEGPSVLSPGGSRPLLHSRWPSSCLAEDLRLKTFRPWWNTEVYSFAESFRNIIHVITKLGRCAGGRRARGPLIAAG